MVLLLSSDSKRVLVRLPRAWDTGSTLSYAVLPVAPAPKLLLELAGSGSKGTCSLFRGWEVGAIPVTPPPSPLA